MSSAIMLTETVMAWLVLIRPSIRWLQPMQQVRLLARFLGALNRCPDGRAVDALARISRYPQLTPPILRVSRAACDWGCKSIGAIASL
jgi:hypothetical protein